MPKLGIFTGSSPNDGLGDSLLEAGIKINSNFNEIYTSIGSGTTLTNTINYSSFSGVSTYASSSGISTISTYATSSGISTVSQGLTGSPNISVNSVSASGIITALNGFITSSDFPGGSVQINVSGSVLTFNVVGVGSTNLNLY
jgi:hypothetical protein